MLLHTQAIEALALESVDDVRRAPMHKIDCHNWGHYPSAPDTRVQIGCTPNELAILFTIEESNPRATYHSDLEPVCQDSCVEFFCKVPGDSQYYNFELNALGTLNASRRIERKVGVQRFTPEMLEQVGRRVTKSAEGWQLLLTIPYAILGHDKCPKALRGNFYKCGDLTESPHYLSLFKVETEKPDYHRPEYFGEIILPK